MKQYHQVHRIADLYDQDPQFRAAQPDAAVKEQTGEPGLTLTGILRTIMDGYAQRPALGQRAREIVDDKGTGRQRVAFLPRFKTITYGEAWSRVGNIASAWHHNSIAPVVQDEFVAIIGFASPEHVILDMTCAYLGLVSVPLAHTIPVPQLTQIITEVKPWVIAASAESLDVAVGSALGCDSVRHIVVFDYLPKLESHRARLESAVGRLQHANAAISIDTLENTIRRGRTLPRVPIFDRGEPTRLAMIQYTSGSTGAPKGAMFSEGKVSRLWAAQYLPATGAPVFNVNYMPLSHTVGRLHVTSALQNGGVCYFVASSDLSTLFDDWALARPTELLLVPRVVEMLFQYHRNRMARLIAAGAHQLAAAAEADAEIRNSVLGGRVLNGGTAAAPTSAELAAFIADCLEVDFMDGYGATEIGVMTRDGVVMRPPVVDYKLADVPELGYFGTDKPHPRGELLIKSRSAMMGYFKQPELTASVFDDEGYYQTGDVVAEIAPNQLSYLDRRSNVLKLSQGEFVAIARLESRYSAADLIHQIFIHGNSMRPNLLAVVVPTEAAYAAHPDTAALKAALRKSLNHQAETAQLRSYEVPTDFLIENQPFTADNGLLSGAGKSVRPALDALYGDRLEQLYRDLDSAEDQEFQALHRHAADQSVITVVTRAARAVLGPAADLEPDARFIDHGGDSLSVLAFSRALTDIFGVEVPVGLLTDPTTTMRAVADSIETRSRRPAHGATFASVHGEHATEVRATDLRLPKFFDTAALGGAAAASRAPDVAARPSGEPGNVVLTGASGWLGRFLALHWLERLAPTGGQLTALIRGRDSYDASQRLEDVFAQGDPQLLRRFRRAAAGTLRVLPADLSEPNLGLDGATWTDLAHTADHVVHAGALVNHLAPYSHLFGPNVAGTAELVRLCATHRIKSITYVSSMAIGTPTGLPPSEVGDIRTTNPARQIDDSPANGYINSKWASEVILREAHDRFGIPVTVFRSDMIMAHSRYRGQVNLADRFTRLLLSVLLTGLAPRTFYQASTNDALQPHFDGMPVDFIARAFTAIDSHASGFRCFNAVNHHDDGVSLDTSVDWLSAAGHRIQRIDDYGEWLSRFETALQKLPDEQQRHSVSPLLRAYRQPAVRYIPPEGLFRSAVRAGKIGEDADIPHVTAALIRKYIADISYLGLLDRQPMGPRDNRTRDHLA
jgi:fatty acid CoA ligase FadD9